LLRLTEHGEHFVKGERLSVTTGGPSDAISGRRVQRRDAVLRPIHRGMLRFTGWDVLAPNIVYGPVRLSEDERLASLNAWAARLLAVEKENPIEVGEY